MHLKQKVMPIWLLQYFVAMLMLSSVCLVLLPISGGRKSRCRVRAVQKSELQCSRPASAASELCFYHMGRKGAEVLWLCKDTRSGCCSWAGRIHEVRQAEKRLRSASIIGYVQWFKYETFTMSTKWTFICNFEDLSKVALWVSFEPYRRVSICLLFSWCNVFILFNQVMMKQKHRYFLHSNALHFHFFFQKLRLSLQSADSQSLSSGLTFSNLEKQPLPLEAHINSTQQEKKM